MTKKPFLFYGVPRNFKYPLVVEFTDQTARNTGFQPQILKRVEEMSPSYPLSFKHGFLITWSNLALEHFTFNTGLTEVNLTFWFISNIKMWNLVTILKAFLGIFKLLFFLFHLLLFIFFQISFSRRGCLKMSFKSLFYKECFLSPFLFFSSTFSK